LKNEKAVCKRSRTRKTSLAEAMTAGFLFGTAAIFVRFLQDLNGFSIVFWRSVIACFALLVILVVLRKPFNLSLVGQNFKELFVLGALRAQRGLHDGSLS
jgi:EamA domain-containing membrane protein RarD